MGITGWENYGYNPWYTANTVTYQPGQNPFAGLTPLTATPFPEPSSRITRRTAVLSAIRANDGLSVGFRIPVRERHGVALKEIDLQIKTLSDERDAFFAPDPTT